MSTILVVPKNDAARKEIKKLSPRIMEAAGVAAKHKTHFLVSFDPEDYEIYASLGVVERVYEDQAGHIRVNMTMFDDALEVPNADALGGQESS